MGLLSALICSRQKTGCHHQPAGLSYFQQQLFLLFLLFRTDRPVGWIFIRTAGIHRQHCWNGEV